MTAPPPADERERLAALRRYAILDTHPEPEFDDLTLLASQICGTPIALINLVDENRQWFKSGIGFEAGETPHEEGFLRPHHFAGGRAGGERCATDERFATDPLVTGPANIRFYAGAPLLTADGHALGTLCVIDHVPREMSAAQKSALGALSRQVVSQLDLRRTVSQLRSTAEELRSKTAFFEAQLNSSGDGILIMDEQGRKSLQTGSCPNCSRSPRKSPAIRTIGNSFAGS
ncbi:MAG: GAF domain-containing protein [Chthoniobacter sp.]